MDYFYNTFESIYEELKKNKKVIVFFACFEGHQKLCSYLKSFVPSRYVVNSLISPFIYFDMFITAEINGPDFPLSLFNTHKVQIYHGIGVVPLHKKIDVLSRFDTHFALGPQLVDFCKILPKTKKAKNDYCEIGFPKLDAIVNPDPKHIKFLKELYNITDQRVIIYAPHWNPFGSLHDLSLNLIERVSTLENVLILIKVHNFLYVRFEEDNWQKKLQDFADAHHNIVYVTRPNTQEIFPLGDLIITDAITTTVFEYSLTGKPVFAYSCPKWFNVSSNFIVEAEMRDMSITYNNEEELFSYIKKVFSNDEEMHKRIERQKTDQKKLLDKYLFNQGNATEAGVKEILRILKVEPELVYDSSHSLSTNRLVKFILAKPLNLLQILFWNLKILFLKLSGIKTIVFNIQMDYFYSTFEPVYLELKKDDSNRIFFAYLESNDKLENFLKSKVEKKSIISSKLSPFINFDMFITAEINGPDFPASFFHTKKVQIYHGTGVYPLYKKRNVLSRFNIHFAVGPQFVEFIDSLPHKKKNQNVCTEIGFPKLDSILKVERETVQKLKEQFSIKSEFVILYTPHWNVYSSLHELGLEMIAALSKIPNVIILIKVHHFLFVRFKEDNWEEKLISFCNKYANVKMVTDPNTQNIYPVGDVMITDTGTTAAFEFSLTNKPVYIFYSSEWFENNNDVDSRVEKDLTEMALCFTNINEVKENIEKLIAKDEEMIKQIELQKKKQNELIKKYLFNPGTATQKALKVIKKELG